MNFVGNAPGAPHQNQIHRRKNPAVQWSKVPVRALEPGFEFGFTAAPGEQSGNFLQISEFVLDSGAGRALAEVLFGDPADFGGEIRKRNAEKGGYFPGIQPAGIGVTKGLAKLQRFRCGKNRLRRLPVGCLVPFWSCPGLGELGNPWRQILDIKAFLSLDENLYMVIQQDGAEVRLVINAGTRDGDEWLRGAGILLHELPRRLIVAAFRGKAEHRDFGATRVGTFFPALEDERATVSLTGEAEILESGSFPRWRPGAFFSP